MNQDNDRISGPRGYENMNRGYEDNREFHRRDWAKNDQLDDRNPYQHDRSYDWNRGGRYDLAEYRGSGRSMANYGTGREIASYGNRGYEGRGEYGQRQFESRDHECPNCGYRRAPQMSGYTGSDDRYFDRGRNDYDRRWTRDGYEQDRRGR